MITPALAVLGSRASRLVTPVAGGQLNGYDLTQVNTGPRQATTSTFSGSKVDGAWQASGTFDKVLFDTDTEVTGPSTFTDCEIQGQLIPTSACEPSTFDFCSSLTQWKDPPANRTALLAIGNADVNGLEDNQWAPSGDPSNYDLITFYRHRGYAPAGHGAMRLLTGSTFTECLFLNQCTQAVMDSVTPEWDAWYHSVLSTNGGVSYCQMDRCASWMGGEATGHASLQANGADIDNCQLRDHYVKDIDVPSTALSWFVMQGIPNPPASSSITNSSLTDWLIHSDDDPQSYSTYGGEQTDPGSLAATDADPPNAAIEWATSGWSFYP